MRKFGKIIGVFIAIILVAVVGLTLFVRFYLTDDRIKQLVVPQAEKTLGRTVAIGAVQVGLFSGITIEDFAIKEADGSTNFVSTGEFVLRYDLMPLLRKELVVNEISLEKPTIRIVRDQNGQFNFDSLAILAKATTTEKTNGDGADGIGLPMALTVDQIIINKARLTVKDELGELPDIDATADIRLNVDLKGDLANLQYSGTADFAANAVYGDLAPQVQGTAKIRPDQLSLLLDVVLDHEKARINTTVRNFATTPDITVDVNSKTLDLDKLLALLATLPGSEQQGSKIPAKQTTISQPLAAALPPGLIARGQVTIDATQYQGATIQDFLLHFNLTDNRLTVDKLNAGAYGGQLISDLQVDLTQPQLAYSGNLTLESIDAAQLGSGLTKKAVAAISGVLELSLSFAGSGTSWPVIQKRLTADGTFGLHHGGFKKMAITSTLAGLLGLPELRDLSYDDITGTFAIVKGGKVQLNFALNSASVTIQTNGTVGLDGSLDLPLTLRLAPSLGDKLKSRASFTRYLADDQGDTVVNLKMTGSIKDPKPTFDTASIKKQLQQTVKGKALELIGGGKAKDAAGAGSTGSQPANLLKGLLGR